MRKIFKRSLTIFIALIVTLAMFIPLETQKAYADEFRDVNYSTAIKCSGKKWYLPVYVKMGSRTKNAKSLTIKSSNKKIVWPSTDAAKYDKAVIFSPQKKGTAIITVKVNYKNGSSKTYKIGVGVKTDPPKVSNSSSSGKKNSSKAKTSTPVYKITFDANGGSVKPKTTEVKKGNKYGNLPIPTRNGYNFDGWYTSKKGGTKKTFSSSLSKNADHTLFAHWTAITYTITYKNLNGADNTNNVKSFTISTPTFSLKAPGSNGYAFCGWYTDKATTKKISTIDKGTHKNIVVYAKWKQLAIVEKMDDITEENCDWVSDAICNGKISAEEVTYPATYKLAYRFESDRGVVNVPLSFFTKAKTGKTKKPEWVDDYLNRRIDEGNGNGYSSFALCKTSTPFKTKTGNSVYSITTHPSTFYSMQEYFIRKESIIEPGIKIKSAVCFDVDEEVYYLGSSDDSEPHAPATPAEMMAAMYRSAEDYAGMKVTLTLKMNKPGPDYWYVNTYLPRGRGDIVEGDPSMQDIRKMINIGFLKTVVTLVTDPLKVSTVDVALNTASEVMNLSDYLVEEKSKDLVGKEDIPLSMNDVYVYECKCKSPVILNRDGDYFKADISFWSNQKGSSVFNSSGKGIVMGCDIQY